MAEFKLGRIRFVWKNNWVTSTTYYVDDVVLVNGKTYLCVTGHTSLSDFNLDLGTNKWELMTDGQKWRSDWQASTQYELNDLVKYGSTVYICTTGHMSQALLESDQSKWDTFAQPSFDWKSSWAIDTYYKVGDLVKYGAGLYRCITGHTSAATLALGLEANVVNWDSLNTGFDYKNNWATDTRYKLNDVVKRGGGLWLCLQGHTSDSTAFVTDAAYWVQFVEGLEFEDTWSNSTAYQRGDIVNYGGYQYVAVENHTGTTPTTTAQTDWDVFSTGFKFIGDYDNAVAYKTGDVVRVGGYTYLCTADSTGNRPPNDTYWNRLNQGQEWNGDWTDATYYDAGDLVRYDNSSYVCVAEHTADETVTQNRPDQDLVGSYWNQMVGGAETTVLTTDGDIVYYSGAGPARLPLGTDGQVLKVNDSNLEWADFGIINNVFYVADNGTDSIDYGYTLDKPFKTVRYGLERIDIGHNSTGAQKLLELNRSFIAAEATEWVDWQIANAAGGSIWDGFTQDDKVKCARDIGQIVDALIWDLGHGGNARTRAATLTYFDSGALIASIQDEYQQLSATLDYMEEVVDAVISNTAPAANYQTLNSVGSPITQQIDATLVELPSDQLTLTRLINIITAALDATVPTDIPVELKPNTSLFVKTGEFKEVLPMIVPERCAIIGDELRSTRIAPMGAITPSGDVSYSLDAISRLQAIMSDIATNGSVTKTSGNAETQVTTRPSGAAVAGAAAANIMQQVYDYIDYGINGATGDSTVPVIAGTNTPQTHTDYTFAVECIEANRAFLVAEVHAYIAATYPSYTYDIAKCSRDVNRYLDAVKYDLIYTGNYKALLAGRYYVNAVLGSVEEDMFYVRDASGIRNCTVTGLTGTLGSDNAYGTKRPSAGAYVSLDAGWGPADTRVWIASRSPYIQNVTSLGTACIGLKVDGALHDGGNDSIVANDFTQVLSDGIGYWVTNLGRSELVSVFTYYNHIGYLAENGGKIRATNGNNSYGAFGSVAEGVDDTETAVTATVNNRYYEAQIGRVYTDATEILALEYNNAGTNYTTENNTYTFSGIGYDQVLVGDEIRDNGIFEVRLLTEGEDYRASANTAQAGTTSQITLAGSETAPSSAYVGMMIFIKTGNGAGQYGYVDTYNSGTKVATILKPSTGTAGWDHLIPGTTIVAPNAVSTYSVEPRVVVAAPTQTITGNTNYSSSRAVDDIAYNGNVFATVTAGSAVVDTSTDGIAWSAGGGISTNNLGKIKGGKIGGTAYFAATHSGNVFAFSTDDGASWAGYGLGGNTADVLEIAKDVIVHIDNTTRVTGVYDGTTYTVGGSVAGSDAFLDVVYSSAANTWLAIAANGVTSYSLNDGTTWSAGALPTLGAGTYSAIAYGNGRFVATAIGTDEAAISFDGVNWTATTMSSSADWSTVKYGQGTFLSVAKDTGGTTKAATSPDGIVWTAQVMPSQNLWQAVGYGTGTWAYGCEDANAVGASSGNFTQAILRAASASGAISNIRVIEPGSGYATPPTVTLTDPSNTVDSTWTVRVGDGALAQPSFQNRGVDWESADGFVTGDGYGDIYQNGKFVNLEGLTEIPQEGANVTFAGDSNYYKLVNVTNLLGTGPYTATLQVSPEVTITDAPEHAVAAEVRIRYSQVRLTGHDFLDIGTGNFTDTNYPGTPSTAPDAADETKEGGGGRVFYTSTDQDGNFRVGELFSVEQSTGKSTLNADAFNLAGLQELQLGVITLGSSNTAINEFSTDGTFAANSDSIVPTQKAIRTYIQSQIGGGGSNLNVNSIQAGNVKIQLNTINHVTDGTINITSRANFTGGISGSPLALNYFLQR